jgi:lipopolysaccharide export system protein LptA
MQDAYVLHQNSKSLQKNNYFTSKTITYLTDNFIQIRKKKKTSLWQH